MVLIDGGSGAGKTSLAEALAVELGATLVSLDSVYPGWHGLAAAQALVPDIIAGRGHPTWDWERGEVNGWAQTPAEGALVVEGCGALTVENAALATATVWCQLDPGTRRHRALARDGEGFRPWWETWAAQERAHWNAHRPWSLAQLVLPMS